MSADIDLYSLAAKPIHLWFREEYLATATGFIWSTTDKIYLITNWHNVSGRNPLTGDHLHSGKAEPDRLKVEIDLRDPIGSRGPFELLLYDEEGDPVWLEHPMRKGVDVVAVPLPPLPGAFPHPINLMPSPPMLTGVGADAFIIGYPFGISTGSFPIWKRASIASEPEVPIDGWHYFFVDSASRSGMSGAPVIARSWSSFEFERDGIRCVNLDPGPHSKFLGVYAGRIGAENELKAQLGRVWHSRLIDEIISGGRRGSPPCLY